MEQCVWEMAFNMFPRSYGGAERIVWEHLAGDGKVQLNCTRDQGATALVLDVESFRAGWSLSCAGLGGDFNFSTTFCVCCVGSSNTSGGYKSKDVGRSFFHTIPAILGKVELFAFSHCVANAE